MTSPSRTERRRAEGSPVEVSHVLAPMVLVVVVVTGWEGWVRVRHVPDYVLPAPSQVAAAVPETVRLLPRHLATTLGETALGLLVGALGGAVVALAVVLVPLVRRSVGPLLVASQTIPMIVLAPLFAVVFGFGLTPKVLVVGLVTFFPVAVSTVTGLDGADDDLVDLVRGLGGGAATVLRVVRVPSALPATFAGLRISSAYAVAGAVIAEGTGGNRGLGFFINRSRASFQVDRIIVAVAVVALVSALLYGLVGLLDRLVTPWRHVASRSSLIAPTIPFVDPREVPS